LASANQLHTGDALDNIDALVVPVAPPTAPASHADVYRARRGDTLVTIADRFGVSLEDLHHWNHLTGSSVQSGQRIRVAEPARVASHSRGQSSGHATAHGKSSPLAQGKTKPKSKGSADARTGNKASGKASSSADAKRQSSSASHKPSEAKKKKVHSKSTPGKNIQK
jgi:membrane-bound lytic murein transglycosylase D